MSTLLAANKWGEIIHQESECVLELRWLPMQMTDGAFKATLALLAVEAEEVRPSRVERPDPDLRRSFLRLAPFSRFGSLFQSSQSRTPKAFDELGKLIEGFHSDHIEALRSHPAFIEKPSLTQHAEVLRDGRSRRLEVSCHGCRVHFAVANKLHDLEPSLVA